MSTSRGRLLVAMARNESIMSTIVKSATEKKYENDDSTFSSPGQSEYQSSCFSSNFSVISTRKELRNLNIDFDSPYHNNNTDNMNMKTCDTEIFQQSIDTGRMFFFSIHVNISKVLLLF